MTKNKIKELERQLAEAKLAEEKIQFEKEREEAFKQGYYIPLKSAKLTCDLYYKGEYNFQEINNDWYTAEGLLGEPDLKEGDTVVLLRLNEDDLYWFPIQEDPNDYYEIESNEVGIISNQNHNILTDIKDLRGQDE